MLYKKFLSTKLLPIQITFFIVFFVLVLFVEFFYIDRSLQTKSYLINDSSQIVFAGDSRAERQLNPVLARKLLNNENIVNIAVSGGDVVMIANLIRRSSLLFKNKILIISISQNQINDGAKDIGYFTNAMISKISLKNKISIFFPEHLKLLKYFYIKSIKNIIPIKKHKLKNTYGFYPITNIYNPSNEKNNFDNHPLYKNWYSNGVKYNLVYDALKFIKASTKSLYLYTGPIAPSFKTIMYPKQQVIENDFDQMMNKLANTLNIPYINYTFKKTDLQDTHFSDYIHLNKYGAEIFTKMIIKDFIYNHLD